MYRITNLAIAFLGQYKWEKIDVFATTNLDDREDYRISYNIDFCDWT